MTVVGYAAGAVVIGLLGAIAAVDARRARISPALVGLLLAAGAVWLLAGGGREVLSEPLWGHGLAAAVGLGVPGLLILAAQLAGRRWPIYPGDAMLMGAVGGIVGPRALAWSVALGCGLAVAHRVCIQRRRGRPVSAGYLPAGPGLALGAALVFGAVSAGMAAEKDAAVASAGVRIQAVEVAPLGGALPADLAEIEISLKPGVEVPFGAAASAVGEAAGITVEIEERPSRIAEGGVALPDAPALALGEGGKLVEVIGDLAGRAGYGWEWRDGKLVFFRYWDRQWIAERAVEVAPPTEKPRERGFLARVVGFLFGSEAEPHGAGQLATVEGSEIAAVPEEEAPAREDEPVEVTKDPAPEEAAAAKVEPEVEETAVTRWEVRPDEQRTLKGVLEDWAGQADWRVAWKAGADFSVGAEAVFEGEFLEAVDGLLSDPQLSRVLVARAYANRYLVIREAGR